MLGVFRGAGGGLMQHEAKAHCREGFQKVPDTWDSATASGLKRGAHYLALL